ncbi:MAG: ribonuclease P protein component [Rhodocyclaceae bacterium]|nr:ribonuclease P protein component [Rhodocyclaceae bacterium]
MHARLGLGKDHRLRKSADFDRVFAGKRTHRAEHFCLHVRDNDQGHARLGLVIPRRYAKSAVLRNAIKRQAREAFRLHQHALGAHDLVLRLVKAWPEELAKPRSHAARSAWRGEIEGLLQKIAVAEER